MEAGASDQSQGNTESANKTETPANPPTKTPESPVKPASEEKALETPKKSGTAANASTPITPDEQKNQTDAEPVQQDLGAPHRLQTGWTFHMDKKRKRQEHLDEKQFKSGLKQLATFSTIEDFYNIWSFLKKPGELPQDVNLYLFRQNLIPAWESFPKGGHWIIKVTKNNGLIELLWEELVMATLGEQFATPELVGIALSTRRHHDIVTLWNRDNRDPRVRFILGERLKTILNLHANTTVEYKGFQDALRDKSTTKDAKQYVYVPQN